MCFLPSCTAIVCPTISGKIVDARDQVLSIFLLLAAFSASMRAIRRSSTHGPFLLERLIAHTLRDRASSLLALAASAAADDVAAGGLVAFARAVAERRHAPRRHRMTARGRRALAAAVRVVDRVHGGAARLRA